MFTGSDLRFPSSEAILNDGVETLTPASMQKNEAHKTTRSGASREAYNMQYTEQGCRSATEDQGNTRLQLQLARKDDTMIFEQVLSDQALHQKPPGIQEQGQKSRQLGINAAQAAAGFISS